MSEKTKYPDCYLHVYECRSGQEWVMEIKGRMTLNLERRIDHWLKYEFGGELKRDGKIQPRIEGEYWAKIMTDGRPPESPICWTSGGFYTMATY